MQATHPRNSGQQWTDAEDQDLAIAVVDALPLVEIAKHLERTTYAVNARIAVIEDLICAEERARMGKTARLDFQRASDACVD